MNQMMVDIFKRLNKKEQFETLKELCNITEPRLVSDYDGYEDKTTICYAKPFINISYVDPKDKCTPVTFDDKGNPIRLSESGRIICEECALFEEDYGVAGLNKYDGRFCWYWADDLNTAEDVKQALEDGWVLEYTDYYIWKGVN